jgi:hypothetical protein
MSKKVCKPGGVIIGQEVHFQKGRGVRGGTIVGFIEALVLEIGSKKPKRRQVVKLFPGALKTIAVILCLAFSGTALSGCSPLPPPGTPKGDAIACAKVAGSQVLKNGGDIVKKAMAQDWTGALATLLTAVGPSVLCEIDVLIDLLKGNGDLAGAVGVLDGALLTNRADLQARLEAFRAIHQMEAKPAK